MRRSLLLLSLASAALVACGSSYSTGPSGGSPAGHDSVFVGAASFSPATVIPNGAGVVTWKWNTGVTHNIVFEDAIAGSGDKSTGSFQRTFASSGTFRYRCTIHSSSFTSGMVGRVVAGTDTTTLDPPGPDGY